MTSIGHPDQIKDMQLAIADKAMRECGIPAQVTTLPTDDEAKIAYVKAQLQARKMNPSESKKELIDLHLRRFEIAQKLEEAVTRVLKPTHHNERALQKFFQITDNLYFLGPELVAPVIIADKEGKGLISQAIGQMKELKSFLQGTQYKSAPKLQSAENLLVAIDEEVKKGMPPELVGMMDSYLEKRDSITALTELFESFSITEETSKARAKKERNDSETIVTAIENYVQGRTKEIMLPAGKETVGKQLLFIERLSDVLRGGNSARKTIVADAHKIKAIVAFLLKQCPNLHGLDFSQSDVTKDTIELLHQFPHLQTLSFQNCKSLTDADLEPLGKCKSLRVLNLSRCPCITGTIFAKLPANLISLNLLYCVLAEANLHHLGRLVGLQELNMGGVCARVTHYSAKAFSFLSGLQELESFNLSGTIFRPEIYRDIAQLKELRVLKLIGCALLMDDKGTKTDEFDDEIILCFHTLIHLQELYIGSPKLTDRALELVGFMPELRKLRIEGAAITGAGFHYLVRCPEFEELEYNKAGKLTDEGFAALTACPQLKRLKLSGYGKYPLKLTDTGLRTMGQFRHLELLDLFLDPNITNEGLAFLAPLHKLRTLHLVSCQGIDNAALPYLQQLKHLQELGLRHTNITLSDAELKQKMANLVTVTS